MALTLRRTLAAGHLVRNLFSPARLPAITHSRSLSTAQSGIDDVEASDSSLKAKTELWWNAEGLHCRFEMPGLDREQVKVWIDPEGVVLVRGEGPKRVYDRSDVDAGRTYIGSVKPRPGISMSDIHTEMKNGVLMVLVRADENWSASDVEYVKVN